MVSIAPSLDLRLSGESADDSGVVPHEESRAPCDIDDVGDPIMELEEVFWRVEIRACPFTLLTLPCPALLDLEAAWLVVYDK